MEHIASSMALLAETFAERLDAFSGTLDEWGVLAAVTAFASSGQRVYLPYLLVSLLIGFLVLYVRTNRQASRNIAGHAADVLQDLFAARIWWHRSARLDYLLFLINPLIRALIVGGSLTAVPIIIVVSDGLYAGFGSLRSSWSPGVVTLVLTLSLFLADDFTRYLLHRLMHRSRLLWSLHRLHHSAEVLTPFTVYRMHPLESVLYGVRMMLTQGLVVGVFFYAFGMNLSAWEVAGANLFTYLFNLLGANLRHSQVWIGYPVWLERWLISPAQHQIHHSADRKHYDKNFGAFLAIWDRLGGSLSVSKGEQVKAFGCAHENNRHRFSAAYWQPLQEGWRVIRTQYKRSKSK